MGLFTDPSLQCRRLIKHFKLAIVYPTAMFDVESLHRNKLGGGLFWRRFSFFIECASAKLLNVFQKKELLTSAVSKSHICEFRSATAGAINGSWSL